MDPNTVIIDPNQFSVIEFSFSTQLILMGLTAGTVLVITFILAKDLQKNL